MSSRGVAASADRPPQRGDIVELIVGENMLVGQVKWAQARRFGVSLRDRVSVISLLSGEKGGVTLRQREAASKQAARIAADGKAQGSKIQFLVFFAAGALATFTIADYVGDALDGLDTVKVAMAAQRR